VAGTFLGVTRLVGENLATLITVALVVAALPPMIRRATGGRGMVGAVALLVAAGLAHWLFLAVFVAVLGVAAALAWPSSRRAMAAGVPGWRTETGTIAGAAGIAAGAMLVLIAGVLRAPFDTIQAREDPSRFGQKLRSDLRRAYLPWTVPVAAFGAVRLGLDEREPRSPARRMALRLLVAWAGVAAAGVLYGIVTKGLPPHRFFELLLAVPVALSLAAAVLAAATWAGRRAGRPLAWAVAAAGVVVIAIPGWSAWYRHNPGEWIQPTALRQAAAAAEYVRGLPAGTPVVFLVSPTGQAGVLSTALNERIIRAAMPPDVQADVYLFPGRAADLLAGRRTITGNPAQNDATLPYWQALQPVLGRDPPVLILRSLARTEYDAAIASGATAPVPGVAILRGPPPATPLRLGPVPVAAPSLRSAVLWGAAVLALLFAIGGGWTALLLGRGASPAVAIALAPAAGVAAIMLAAVLPARAGVGLGGAAGVVLFVVVALAGWALAWWDRRTSQRPAASAPAPATVP
jgi:hypothetical protein